MLQRFSCSLNTKANNNTEPQFLLSKGIAIENS